MRNDVINDAWKFGGIMRDGADLPEFDDTEFQEVTIPHCVTDMSWRFWEPKLWETEWIYRRHFTVPPDAKGSRIFLHFEGVMTGATPVMNGTRLAKHLGGYLPFEYEITDMVSEGDNLLAVIVDGSWLNVPPSGHEMGSMAVDYMQPAGIYRDVWLQVVPLVFIKDVFAKPIDVLEPTRRVQIECLIDGATPLGNGARLGITLSRQGRAVAESTAQVDFSQSGRTTVTAMLDKLGEIELWDLDCPALYDLEVSLFEGENAHHTYRTRIGFRDARFTPEGFFLNGRRLKIFGLNRHQLYPYVGMAMPKRAQRKDAELLKKVLNCNMVRCSHYPQSRHFMDACDELGLLVFEEVPGWQYIGDTPWQELFLRDVKDMILRNRNRPSVVTWGVRINESRNDPELYQQARAIAKLLDDSRPTTGAMVGGLFSTEDWFQDLFAFNDYRHNEEGSLLRGPIEGVPFLMTEAVGSLVGPKYYRRIDTVHIQQRQAYLHAQAHDQVAGNPGHCGLLAWSAIDYPSEHGWVDQHLKWNGVLDTFRVPKLGASFYMSQIDPEIRPVIEPAFYWDFCQESPLDGPGKNAMICANCDRLEVFIDDQHYASVRPDRSMFPDVAYPPCRLDLFADGRFLPELRIDGYVNGELVLSRRFASDPSCDVLSLQADDEAIAADGVDATRVVFRVLDKYGAPRPYVKGEIAFTLDGPGILVGDNPFVCDATGGVGAVWIKGKAGHAGEIVLRAAHPDLGQASVSIRSRHSERS